MYEPLNEVLEDNLNNRKPFTVCFFILVAFLILSNSSALSIQSKSSETNSVSNILGRTDRLNDLCDDFEDPNWEYDRQNHISSNRFWRGSPGLKGSDESDRGDPQILERVIPPKNGKSGSTGALKIGTNIPDDDNNPSQDDLRTLSFEEKLERKLTRIDQPVFIMRIWLPSFDQLGNNHQFGFRLEAKSNVGWYYPSIWLIYNEVSYKMHLVLRIFYLDGNKLPFYNVDCGSIKQSGWWTLAIAFDKMGICSYYIRPGVGALTEKNKIYDDTQFTAKYGIKALLMDYVNAGLLSLGYFENNSKSPIFEIDDYEVWVSNNSTKKDI